MSTKDLIERLNRAPARTVTRAATPKPKETGDNDEVQTRVNRGVIRRRKVTAAEEEAEAAAQAAAAQAAARRRVVRRPAAEPVAEAAAPESIAAEPVAAAPVAATQGAATQAPEPVTAEPVAATQAAATSAPEPVAAVPVAATQAAATPASEPVAAAPVAATQAAATPASEPVAAAPVAATQVPEPVAAQPVAAAPVAVTSAAATPAPEPVAAAPVAATSAAVTPTPEAATVAAPAAEAVHAPVAAAPSDEAPTAGETARRGLPRLVGGERGAKPSFPGLGSAVVAPPPGYDPTDPAGNRRRAQEAARRSTEPPPSAAGQPAAPVWRDEAGAAGAPRRAVKDEFRDRDRAAKGRVKPKRKRQEATLTDDLGGLRRRRNRKRVGPKKISPRAAAHKRRVEVNGTISVANLAHGMAVKASQVIKKLIAMGQMATMNDELDLETAQLVAEEFEFEAVDSSFSEDDHMMDIEDDEEEEGQEERPPVVTIMGHVDHGKTTLLDSIRKANVAAGEAGGITQHTSAYQVEKDGRLITFIDTPGHEAFTAMRARGAQVTDIVVLVVAAEDGVMPQTVEALNHAKAAGVQILVAINKIDKPGANPDRIKQAFLEYELVPEEYGGETMFVPISALKGTGIPDLLEAINLISDVGEYTANPERHAEGTVLEARLEKGRGPVANVLVQKGTLRQGDRVVMGTTWGRVRAMVDCYGKALKEAGPSTPVEIIGLQDVPSAGDNFVVVANDKDAKALAENRMDEVKRSELAEASGKKVTLEDLLKQKVEGEKLHLNLVVKADVGGTLEAMKGSIRNLSVEGTDVKVLHSGVGAISESDVTLARTYGAVLIGFNVRPDSKARRAADEFGVEIRVYNVIYEALEDIEKALKGLLGPTYQEKVRGVAEVRELFTVPKVGTIAGCRVTEGTVSRNHQVRLLRDGTIIWTGRLASLRRFKEDVREVQEGYECGMNLDGYNDLKSGDLIEAFSQEEVAPA